MDYISIFDAPPLNAILLSVLQTLSLFVFVIVGLKLVGRRVFGEQGPQDLVILVLIAEACDTGLNHQAAGYWGSIASVASILVFGFVCERVPFIRRFLEGDPVVLYSQGVLNRKMMKKHMVDEQDLELTARQYGLASYREFTLMMLEGDGKVTGVAGSVAARVDKN